MGSATENFHTVSLDTFERWKGALGDVSHQLSGLIGFGYPDVDGPARVARDAKSGIGAVLRQMEANAPLGGANSHVASPRGSANEADHRIKNSLQMVAALLSQQTAHAALPDVRYALMQASLRIGALCQVHALLSATHDGDLVAPAIALDVYLRKVSDGLRDALTAASGHHAIDLDIEPVTVSPALAQRLGLIVTELVVNAMRHGLDGGKPGRIHVTGGCRGDTSYQLCVEDDGRGLPRDFDIRRRGGSFGLRVVLLLCDQSRARIEADGRIGARFTITLPMEGVVRGARADDGRDAGAAHPTAMVDAGTDRS